MATRLGTVLFVDGVAFEGVTARARVGSLYVVVAPLGDAWSWTVYRAPSSDAVEIGPGDYYDPEVAARAGVAAARKHLEGVGTATAEAAPAEPLRAPAGPPSRIAVPSGPADSSLADLKYLAWREAQERPLIAERDAPPWGALVTTRHVTYEPLRGGKARVRVALTDHGRQALARAPAEATEGPRTLTALEAVAVVDLLQREYRDEACLSTRDLAKWGDLVAGGFVTHEPFDRSRVRIRLTDRGRQAALGALGPAGTRRAVGPDDPVLFSVRLAASGRTWHVFRSERVCGVEVLDGYEPPCRHSQNRTPMFRLPWAFFVAAAEAVDDRLIRDKRYAGVRMRDLPKGRD